METVEKIQEEIKSLPQVDYNRLIKWIYEKDWKNWDRQIESDSTSGRLDFLLDEAPGEKTTISRIYRGKIHPAGFKSKP